MSDVLVHDGTSSASRSFLDEPPFDRGVMTLGPATSSAPAAAAVTKTALVELIYNQAGRAEAAVVIRPGAPDLYTKLYGMLPQDARSMPLLAKSWRVFAVLCTRQWAEDNLTRPRGTPMEIGL